MSKLGTWSTTPANNNSTPPDGWPEGQAPSTVNDCAREMMAQVRTYINDAQYIDLNDVPTRTGATTFTFPTNVVSTYEIGRRIKCFDNTTLYGTIISATFAATTNITLRLDSGVLTSSLSSVAIAVLSETNRSLPAHVYKRKNLIINGQMDIWQRSASFQLSASSGVMYTADRFGIELSAVAQLTVTRSERSANASNVPTLAQCGAFLTSSLLISVSAVDAALAAGEYSLLTTKVEGYDWKQIAHKPNMLSFWVQSDTTGTYCIAARNSNNDRSFVQEYTITAASTWEKKTIQIPEATTAGTWDYSSGIGLAVSWCIGSGATYQGGAGNWTAANIVATSNQTNLMASAGQVWAITGIQLEEGQVATPLEIRPYQQEVEMCKRYCQIIPASRLAPGVAISTSRGFYTYQLAPEMRTTPTVTYPAVTACVVVDGATGNNISVSAIATQAGEKGGLDIDVIAVGTPLVAGQGSQFYLSTGAANVIILSAEL